MAANIVTHDDITAQFSLLRSDPDRFLELANALVEQNPDDARAYFSRHWGWQAVGSPDLALEDLNKSLALEVDAGTYETRGWLLHGIRRYREAINDFDRSEQLDPEAWKGGFGPLFRADCYARLGDEEAALRDWVTLPNDHWTPGMKGLPKGNKEQVAAELRRRAAAACRPEKSQT